MLNINDSNKCMNKSEIDIADCYVCYFISKVDYNV